MFHITNPRINASVDLATLTIALSLPVDASSPPANGDVQVFYHNDTSGAWDAVSTDPAKPVALFPGQVASVALSVTPELGVFSMARIIIFQSGTNFGTVLYDSQADYPHSVLFAAPASITTQQQRLTKIHLSIDPAQAQVPGTDGKLHVPFTLQFPAGTDPNTIQEGGEFLQAKGNWSTGFAQMYDAVAHGHPGVWNTNVQTASGPDPYLFVTGEFVVPMPTVNGLYSLTFMSFTYSWSLIEWEAGFQFSVGGDSWFPRCDPSKRPLLTNALKPASAVHFANGGNLGNAMASGATDDPANYRDPNYFSAVAAAAHLTILRENIDADKYMSLPIYAQKVRAHVEAMHIAGVVPVLAAQGMPKGSTAQAQEDALATFLTRLLNDFADVLPNVGFDVINEPYQYGSWAAWKPVQVRMLSTMRQTQPGAYLIACSEGYSKSLAAMAADPLPTGLADAVAIHAYIPAAQLASAIPASLSNVWVEEWHTPDPAFAVALQGLKNVTLQAAWAWDIKGQDGLNLVDHVSGAVPTWSADGTIIAGWQAGWAAGKLVSVPSTTPAGGGGATSGLTSADVQKLIDASLLPVKTSLATVQASVTTMQTTLFTMQATVVQLQSLIKSMQGVESILATRESLLNAKENAY